MAKAGSTFGVPNSMLVREHVDSVLGLRKVCKENCGYDKSLSVALTGPFTQADIDRIAASEESNFSSHEHESTITHVVFTGILGD